MMEGDPGIIQLIDFSIEDTENAPFIVLEYAPKGTLLKYVKAQPFHQSHAKVIFKELISAVLSCFEKGISHRDLKLENVLIDHEYKLKLCDFGMAAPIG